VQTDAELVCASRDGDRAAFGVLIDRHVPRVRGLARALLRNPEEAADVTQEALLRAYLGLSELREPARFGSWVGGIAVNLAKMRLRQLRDGQRSAAELSGGRLLPGKVDLAATNPSPEQAAEAAELLEVVRSAIERLPSSQRDAVLLHYIEGLTCEEIAAVTGETAGTVRVRLHRARHRLREELGPLRKEMEFMTEVTLQDVIVRMVSEVRDDELPRLANERLRIVLLAEKNGNRVLPIWVGASEGDALALQLGGESMPRPLTADFMARLVEASGSRVERVTISSLRDQTFYATVEVTGERGSHEIDARPSDALNLAARVGAPIFIDQAVMDVSVSSEDVERTLDEHEAEFAGEPGGSRAASEWRSLSPTLVKSLYPGPRGRKEPPGRSP
jgi:RNA polymerase sigma factor (sigma-70 family)